MSLLTPKEFVINTEKSQGNESVLVAQLREELSSLESDQKSAKRIAGKDVAYSEVLWIKHVKIQHIKYNTQKYNTHVHR